MARSTYVYVVTKWDIPRMDNPEVCGVFTVKHEMVSEVERTLRQGYLTIGRFWITRYRDGFMSEGTSIDDQFQWVAP